MKAFQPKSAGSDFVGECPAARTPPSGTQVRADSKLYVWWLTQVRGYHIVLVRRTPVRRMLGRIGYDSTWVLEHR